VLLKNGTLVDGTGAPARRADVGIAGGKIVEVGELKGAAKRTIDADGLVVAPGFIDPHTTTTRRSAGMGRLRRRAGMG